jgi:hypothetical protein
MKKKMKVGLFGKNPALIKKLNQDLSALGFNPFEIVSNELTYPQGTVAAIGTEPRSIDGR